MIIGAKAKSQIPAKETSSLIVALDDVNPVNVLCSVHTYLQVCVLITVII